MIMSGSVVSGGLGIEELTVICTSVQEKSKWLSALKSHVKAMNASAIVKPQHLQVVTTTEIILAESYVFMCVSFGQHFLLKRCICGWYTPCSKNVSHLMFDNNFGRRGPTFKILSPGDLQENSLCTHHNDFNLTCNMLLHYLLKVENLNVTKFPRRKWQLIYLTKFNARSYVTCHKNITLMILLKYVYNTRSIAQKERRRCEDNHGERIAVIQQRSTEQCSAVDWDVVWQTSKCQSVSVSSLETVCLTTVKC